MGIDIDAMRKVCEMATKGPIRVREFRRPGFCAVVETEKPWDAVGTTTIASYERDEDAEFHIAARTALPAALDEIEALRKALAAMLEPQTEACRFDHHGLCQSHHLRTNERGEPECEVAMARAALRAHEGKVKS